jgi:lipid-A-disaccharide synthase
VWAWKEGRVKLLKKYVDRLFVIFPFETEYFRNRGIEAIYEGNPLVDEIEEKRMDMPVREEFFKQNNLLDDKPVVALLAGSRRSEIGYNLPFMVALARCFPHYRFVIAGVGWIDRVVYDEIVGSDDIGFVCNQTYTLLEYAEAAVVTSGTATLETALIGTPEMVCYKADWLSMRIGRIMVKIKYFSLVNIIMGREVVRELLQWDMKMPTAETELRSLLPGGAKREKMQADFAELCRMVGEHGASERFAARMVEILKA